MAQSIAHQAEAGAAWRTAEPGKARKGTLRQLWAALRDAYVEIRDEVRLIVG
jgi:hypothetical protein